MILWQYRLLAGRPPDPGLTGAQFAATAGAVGVLHTHNRRLDLHPHVHMVMPAAALDADKEIWLVQGAFACVPIKLEQRR